jgi:hypothetical protein
MTRQLTDTKSSTLAATTFLCAPKLPSDTRPMTDCEEVAMTDNE